MLKLMDQGDRKRLRVRWRGTQRTGGRVTRGSAPHQAGGRLAQGDDGGKTDSLSLYLPRITFREDFTGTLEQVLPALSLSVRQPVRRDSFSYLTVGIDI